MQLEFAALGNLRRHQLKKEKKRKEKPAALEGNE
jgi:hypothetical protein